MSQIGAEIVSLPFWARSTAQKQKPCLKPVSLLCEAENCAGDAARALCFRPETFLPCQLSPCLYISCFQHLLLHSEPGEEQQPVAIARSQRVSFDARGHVSARSWAPQHQGLILLPEQPSAPRSICLFPLLPGCFPLSASHLPSLSRVLAFKYVSGSGMACSSGSCLSHPY